MRLRQKKLAAMRNAGQSWERLSNGARLHTGEDWQRAVDKVVVCRPGRSPSRDPHRVGESHLFVFNYRLDFTLGQHRVGHSGDKVAFRERVARFQTHCQHSVCA
jgi:hypothetical protein